MSVEFDSKKIWIVGRELHFDPYYFALAAEDSGSNWQDIVILVLLQWARALETSGNSGVLFLPFGIYDEGLSCLKAVLNSTSVVLRIVWLEVTGYSMDLTDLSDFINEAHSYIYATPNDFAEFSRETLIEELKNATPKTVRDP